MLRLTNRELCVAVTLLGMAGSARGADVTVANAGDAFIARDAGARTWTIGNPSINATFLVDRYHELRLVRLLNPVTGHDWETAAAADTLTTISGRSSPLGALPQYLLGDVQASVAGASVHLAISFHHRDSALRVTRHYVVWAGAPAIETWTRFDAESSAGTTISDLNVWRFAVTGQQIEWINGLRGDSSDVAHNDAFSLRQSQLNTGDSLVLGSEGRSSEREVPYFKIVSGGEALVGGLLWSGAWRLTLQGVSGGTLFTFGLPATVTTVAPSMPVETPHGFLAVASTAQDSSAAVSTYVRSGLRRGRGFGALVTYNTWFAYGTNIDERGMLDEIEHAADLGTELFVLDAGWYAGANTRDRWDFTPGLGNWHADEARFPSGLRALTDAAHAHGMRFGLWIEPERIALASLSDGAADEAWLATVNGAYLPGNPDSTSAQLCLASAGARQWILGEIERLIDEAQPDYLKWDNNFWVNCDRSGHGHGASDGNFAHVTGLYDVLATLRQRHPDLMIENVSGGGNRVDYGMLGLTDVAWMDDRTAPSIHVRHNFEGLGTAMPPSYLFSFVIDHVGESLQYGDDIPLYIRSRMAGVLGLTFRSADLSGSTASEIAEHIRIYKGFRDTIREGSSVLLTPQAAIDNPPAWDALQVTDSAGRSLLFAFQIDQGVGRVTLRLRGLKPDAAYDVESIDAGPIGRASGADLMAIGVEIVAGPASAAHLLILTETTR